MGEKKATAIPRLAIRGRVQTAMVQKPASVAICGVAGSARRYLPIFRKVTNLDADYVRILLAGGAGNRGFLELIPEYRAKTGGKRRVWAINHKRQPCQFASREKAKHERLNRPF